MNDRAQDSVYATWPYATDYVLNTLDPTLIEAHARLTLSRALNTGRLVVFVGAGISAAYGRMMWGDVLRRRAAEVLKETQDFLDCCVADYVADPDTTEDIRRLDAVLRDMGADKGNITGGSYTVVSQLCEQLAAAVRRGKGEPSDPKSPLPRNEMNDAVDDRAKAQELLERALPGSRYDPMIAADVLDGDMVLGSLDREGCAGPLCRIIEARFTAIQGRAGDHGGEPLYPLDRPLMGAGLRLGLLKPESHHGAVPDRGTAREYAPERPPKARDPLRILRDDLQIARFMTTNYDREIERLLAAGGRQRPDAAPPSVVVFGPDKAPDLIAFAAENRRSTPSLVYLHGRISNDIVATEHDYQERYCRNGPQREQIDTAIGLAFGANPLLFVGSSMGEDDILRPLRQFMSEPQRVGDRVAVALLPGTKSRGEQLEEKSRLLVRYGIYAIHFGRAETANGAGDWLHFICSVCKALREAFGRIAKVEAVEDARGFASIRLEAIEALLAETTIFVADGTLLTPSKLEGLETNDLGLNVGREVEILRACLDWLRDRAKPLDIDQPHLRDEAVAHDLACEGALTSIVSILSCASLLRAEHDWQGWKSEWFTALEPRKAENNERDAPPGAPFTPTAKLIYRHPINMRPWAETKEWKGRFYAGAPSQTLDELCRALRLPQAQEFRDAKGRRLLALAARRGLGKGHFFNALENVDIPPGTDDEGRLYDLLRALSPFGLERWAGCAFFNLSFAHEVMSAFDRLTEFLISTLTSGRFPGADRIAITDASLHKDRVERLSYALKTWAELGGRSEGKQRLLVAFNSFGLLFDSSGKPKNGQVKHLFDLIVSEEFAAAPIDFIFVCQDGSIPAYFRRSVDDHGNTIHALVDPKDEGKDAVRARHRLERLGVLRPGGDRPEVAGASKPGSAAAVHVLKPARATLYVSAYFPRIGILLCRRLLRNSSDEHVLFLAELIQRRRDETIGIVHYPNIFEDHAAHFREAMRNVLNRFAKSGDPADVKVIVPAATVVISLLLEAGAVRGGDSRHLEEVFESVVDRCWRGVRRVRDAAFGPGTDRYFTPSSVVDHTRWTVREAAAQILIEKAGLRRFGLQGSGLATRISRALDVLFRRYDEAWRDYYDAVGGERHLLTLVLASAYESTTELSAVSDNLEANPTTLPIALIDAATKSSFEVLESVRGALMGGGDASPSQVVLKRVREVFRTRAADGCPLPMKVRLAEAEDADKAEPPLRRRLRRPVQFNGLLEVLVSHLSLIGEPVMADVLAWCPMVRRSVGALKTKPGGAPLTHEEVEVVVREALKLGVNRCLIFPLRPNGTQREDDERALRYAVHRQIQRDRLREYGILDIEFAEVDQFTLTIYASQPSQTAILPWDKHEILMEAMSVLAGYPSPEGRPIAFETTEAGDAADDRSPGDFHRRLLRASFGIARSAYSMSTLTRLRRPRDSAVDGSPGCMEVHRRLLWWLVMSSKRLGVQPFYAEEVVWLNNEVAVLSLAQGRLNDAQALFQSALIAAKEIEHDESGALHVRINLNRAHVAIERGKGDEIRPQLLRIASMTDEHEVLPLLAEGYLGLSYHLAGESLEAARRYRHAIEGLRRLRRHRGVSIFARHLADLLHQTAGATDPEFRQSRDEALNLAIECGHEDMEHLIRLAMVKHRIEGADATTGVGLHGQLQAVEKYARESGMPRLLCEVSFLRARLLQVQGDHGSAARHAAEALGIACVNDLRLRKASSLLLLGGLMPSARPLIDLGRRMAREGKAQSSLSYGGSLGV